MASVSTAAMTLDQRLKLLLIQFDLGFVCSVRRKSGTLALRRASECPAKGSLRFSDVDLTLAEYQKIKSKASASRMRRNKNTVTITGPVDELVMVRDFIVKSVSPPAPKTDNQQFTLKVTSRRSTILAAIGNQLKMSVDTSSADSQTMEEVVELSVKNVSLQELLDKIMEGSGASCVLADGKIVVGQQ